MLIVCLLVTIVIGAALILANMVLVDGRKFIDRYFDDETFERD